MSLIANLELNHLIETMVILKRNPIIWKTFWWPGLWVHLWLVHHRFQTMGSILSIYFKSKVSGKWSNYQEMVQPLDGASWQQFNASIDGLKYKIKEVAPVSLKPFQDWVVWARGGPCRHLQARSSFYESPNPPFPALKSSAAASPRTAARTGAMGLVGEIRSCLWLEEKAGSVRIRLMVTVPFHLDLVSMDTATMLFINST